MTPEAAAEAAAVLGGPPEPRPDARVAELCARHGGPGRSVVEFGCWTGAHTALLARAFGRVTAHEARPASAAAALLRLSLLGLDHARVRVGDVAGADPGADCLLHCGVLYHLADPYPHLVRVLARVRAIALWTHVNHPGLPPAAYPVPAGRYREHGWADRLSGLGPESLWLDADVIADAVRAAGLAVVTRRAEAHPHGPALYLLAERPLAEGVNEW